MRDFSYKGKFILLLSLGIFITFFCTLSPKAASDDSGILQQIANNTYNALYFLVYLTFPDSTQNYSQTPTPALQYNLGNIVNQMMANESALTTTPLLTAINSNLMNNKTAKEYQKKSNANPDEISISTLFGVPPSGKTNNLAQSVNNYILNISGMGLTHQAPGVNWQGDSDSQQRYNEYYNTVNSVATYNNYILNGLAVAFNNNFNLTTLQNNLLNFAITSKQLPLQIAQEPIALVLRQSLLFNSQIYALLIELVQTQRKLLHTQAMTNTLLIINSGSTEVLYKSQAQGTIPGKGT